MTPQLQRKCFQKSFLVGLGGRGYGWEGAADKERGGVGQGDGSISGGNFWEIGKEEEEETPFWSSSLSSCFAAAAAAGSKRKEGKRQLSCSSQKF